MNQQHPCPTQTKSNNATNSVPWSASVTVACVVKKDGKFLCVEELSKQTGEFVINQPAGHVEANETLIQACVRETLEETAWHVKVTDFLGVYSFQPPAKPEKTYYRFCFIADAISFDETVSIDTDIEKATWYSLSELTRKNNLRSPLVLKCFEDFDKGKRVDLSVITEFLLGEG